MERKVNIVSTIGPSTDTKEMIEKLMDAGTRVFRQNFSHGAYEEKLDQMQIIREVAKAKGLEKEVKVLQDLQGPKIRLGDVKDDHKDVKTGQEIVLDYALREEEHDGGDTIPVQYDIASKLHAGDIVFIWDGKVKATVVEVVSPTAVKIKIENDGILKRRKGINMIGAKFNAEDIYPAKDHEDMKWGADKGYDWLAVSFTQNAEDLVEARKLMKQYGYPETTQLVTKVETHEATKTDVILDAVVKEADVVMIARGDMGYEVGPEKVPLVQRKLIVACRKHGKESIVATQTVSTMEHEPQPTRAEADNVFASHILGADYVMTSEETAVGSWPVEATAMIRKVLDYAEDNSDVISLEELARITRYSA